MKKLLLSFFMCMLAIIGMQAAEVTFNFAFSGTIDGLSTAKEKKSSDTFTIDGYTFDAYSCYKSSNNSAKYLMVEKLSLGGKLTLPSFSGKKVTAVSVLTGTGASTSVKVGLYKGEELIEEKTLNAQGANFTYNVEDDDATGTRYILKVTNDKNAQFQNIVITYETAGEGGGEDPEQPGQGGGEEPETPVEPTPDPEDVDMYVWTLVKDASTLVAGDKVVIVAVDTDFALSTTQEKDYRGQAAVDKDGETITFGDDVQVLTLEAGTKVGTWAFNTGSGYLYAASSSSNHLKTQTTNNDNGSWLITIEEGVTKIEAQGEYTRNMLLHNGTATRFSCYGSTSNQAKDVQLYRREYAANITSNNCYVVAVGNEWEEPAGCWYAAKFINKNTGEFTWSAVAESDAVSHGYLFYLAPGNTPLGHEPQLDPDYKYTHVEFVQIPSTVEAPADIRNLNLTDVDYKTSGEIWYDGKPSKVYSLAEEKWLDEATGVNRVEMAGGIGYAYGVVSAEGAIEVYNVNGAVVARGNDNVDLRGLGRGVYIIRNGNQVRKVVR